jgi:hypothetical protein
MTTWFNLPSKVKERFAVLQASTLTCLDDPNKNSLVDGLNWFRLPEKIQALIEASNEELLGNEYDPGKTLRWFNLPSDIEAWFTHLESLTGDACF